MDHITLQKVDEANFLSCFALKLKPEQEGFVSHPIRSLAQAYVYYKQCTPFAVCFGGEALGFSETGRSDEDEVELGLTLD